TKTLIQLDNQLCGAGADLVRPARRTPRVEVEIDAVLAKPRDLSAATRVGHDMDEAQRGIAEMRDTGLDEIRLVEPERALNPQRELECRETAPALFHVFRIHADRRAGLHAGIGKAMHDCGEPEMSRAVESRGPDPAARGRDKGCGGRGRGPSVGDAPLPSRA